MAFAARSNPAYSVSETKPVKVTFAGALAIHVARACLRSPVTKKRVSGSARAASSTSSTGSSTEKVFTTTMRAPSHGGGSRPGPNCTGTSPMMVARAPHDSTTRCRWPPVTITASARRKSQRVSGKSQRQRVCSKTPVCASITSRAAWRRAYSHTGSAAKIGGTATRTSSGRSRASVRQVAIAWSTYLSGACNGRLNER